MSTTKTTTKGGTRLYSGTIHSINKAMAKSPVLNGCDRAHGKGYAISRIADILSEFALNLDMVSGDTIMGEFGNRQLDIFEGENRVEGTTVSFTWCNLSCDPYQPRWEFIAYVA